MRGLATSSGGACAVQTVAESPAPNTYILPASKTTSISALYVYPPGAKALRQLLGEFSAEPGAEYVVRIVQVAFDRAISIQRVRDGVATDAVEWVPVAAHRCPR